MSLADPAARSATARASRYTSGSSTGTGETTASTSVSGPGIVLLSTELDDVPVATGRRVRSGTRTRTPGATPGRASGTRSRTAGRAAAAASR